MNKLYYVLPYEPGDSQRVDGEDIGSDGWLCQHPSYTLYYRGTPICSAGVVLQTPDHGEAWVSVSMQAPCHGLAIVRYVRKYLRLIMKQHHLRFVQSYVLATDPHSAKWNRALGFVCTSGPELWDGEPHYQYILWNEANSWLSQRRY